MPDHDPRTIADELRSEADTLEPGSPDPPDRDEPEPVPTINPDCCTEGHENILLALQPDGRTPTSPESWYLHAKHPGGKWMIDGQVHEMTESTAMILVRYCPYCGTKLDPTRED